MADIERDYERLLEDNSDLREMLARSEAEVERKEAELKQMQYEIVVLRRLRARALEGS